MVYESSTRRIYSSSPRPVISSSYSYSPALPVEDVDVPQNPKYYYLIQVPALPTASPVGPIPVVTKMRQHPHLVLTYSPGSGKGYVINPLAIPHVAHKRLASTPPPATRIRNGQHYYDLLEPGNNYGTNRIVLVRYRPSPPPQSKVIYIEDVTNRRELSPSPCPSLPALTYGSPWDIATPMGMVPCIPRPMFSLHSIPLRLYVQSKHPDASHLYRTPLTLPQSYYIGRGNLACLSFAAGRPISKRRRFYPDYDDKIRDEVIFRSFYTKLRDAANAGRNAGKRPIYQPIYYSRKTILGEENVEKRVPKESKWVERALANEKPPTPRAKKPAPLPEAAEIVVAPPRKESLKMEAAPRTPPPVKPVNVTLPGPRKSITEIIPEHVPKVETLPEEKVTVKMPKEEPAQKPREPTPPPAKEPTPPPPKEPTPPPPKEPTPPPPKEPTPPPKEPTPPPPAKEPTPPPPAKEPTPPPAKEPTPPPPAKEATPPPPTMEATPPPPAQESAPAPTEEPAPSPAAEEPPAAATDSAAPAPAAESGSEPISEVSAPAAAASDQATGDEASNKGEVEDIQLDEEITLDEVCDVEENDLEIESDDPETSQSAAQVESPKETSGSVEPSAVENEPAASPASEASATAPEPAIDNQQDTSAAPVSICVDDIDGPVPAPDEEALAVQEEPLTVEQIQAEAERRREEFAKLLEEHAELVTTVTKLEKVAVIVSKSCAEAIAQQESEQQPPKTTS